MRILYTSVIVLITSKMAAGLMAGVTVNPDELYDLFKQFLYIPDGIDYAPLSVLNVEFKEAKAKAYFNQLGVTDTLIRPVLSWNDTEEGAGPDSRYTVVFADIDGGDPHLLLWLVTNILNNDVDQGDQLIPYQYPNPPKKYRAHRMLLLVYRQPTTEKIRVNLEMMLGEQKDRTQFDVQLFQEYYNYTKWPIAGNFFQQYPLFVPYGGIVQPWMAPFMAEIDKIETPPPLMPQWVTKSRRRSLRF